MLTLLCAVVSTAWGNNEPQALFHETFGNNTGSARAWSDSYSEKSGVEAVYSGITGYTVTNVKQSKNTMGYEQSGLAQNSTETDAYIIIGPLNVANYSSLKLSYYWKAASIKATYTNNAYYATSSNGEYTKLTESTGNNGATTFVEQSYNLPVEAQVSTLYLKIVYKTSNTQAVIDEVDLSGVAGNVQPTGENYELFSSNFDLVEGDYIITYTGGNAMSNEIVSNTLNKKQAEINESVITTNDKTIVWHIAPSTTTEGYWTIKSLDDEKYAASTGSDNQATTTENIDDKALWSVDGKFGFINKSTSKNLRFHNYSFSCSDVGEQIFSLYRKHVEVATPEISPNSSSFTETQSVEITCETPGVSIYYTTDDTAPTSGSTLYTGAFTINETTNVKAIAIIADDESEIAEATFTKLTPMSIADVRTQNIGTTVYTQGIVTSIYNQTAYIQDATAAICVYGNENLIVGQEIKVRGDLETYHELLEISSPIWTVVSSDNEVQPEVMTIAQVNASTKQGWLVKIENATVTTISGKEVTIAQGENNILVRFNDTNDITFFENDIITLTGNIGCYDGVQIANPTNIKVNVDMYYVAGSWTNWADNMIEMKRNSDGTYTLADQVVNEENVGEDHPKQFKIVKVPAGTTNNTWCGGPDNGQYWGINENTHDNITLNVGSGPNFKLEYYGTWTFTVDPTGDTPKLTVDGNWLSYYLVGSFNEWNASENYKLTKNEETGKYTISKSILNEQKFQIIKLNGSEDTWYGAISNDDYWFEEKDCDKGISLIQSGKDFIMKLSNPVAWNIEFDPVNMKLVLSNFVRDYATLPFEYNDGKGSIENTLGLTQSGLGSDYNTTYTKLKFDGTGDFLVLKFKESPGILSFNIKGNNFTSGSFTVQTSKDGETYTDLKTYTTISNNANGQQEEFDNLDADVRYIKWIFTEHKSGNVGLGNIELLPYVAPFTFTISSRASDGTDCYATIADLGEGYFKVAENVEVMTVTVDGGKLIPSSPGEIIPGDGAYLVKCAKEKAGTTFTFQAAKAGEVTALDQNMLISSGEGNVSPDDMLAAAKELYKDDTDEFNYKFYKLSLNGGGDDNSVGFYWGAEKGAPFTYRAHNQAYLAVAVPKTENPGQAVAAYLFNGDKTGIYNITTTEVERNNNATYTLSGIRVENKQLPKGIYIKNGKKVVVR